jgi:hypothetical protein
MKDTHSLTEFEALLGNAASSSSCASMGGRDQVILLGADRLTNG